MNNLKADIPVLGYGNVPARKRIVRQAFIGAIAVAAGLLLAGLLWVSVTTFADWRRDAQFKALIEANMATDWHLPLDLPVASSAHRAQVHQLHEGMRSLRRLFSIPFLLAVTPANGQKEDSALFVSVFSGRGSLDGGAEPFHDVVVHILMNYSSGSHQLAQGPTLRILPPGNANCSVRSIRTYPDGSGRLELIIRVGETDYTFYVRVAGPTASITADANSKSVTFEGNREWPEGALFYIFR